MKEKINYFTFVGVALILVVLVVFYQDWRSSQNIPPQSTSAAQEKGTSTDILNNIFSTSPQVKKSTTDICHEKGISLHYDRTQNYTSYNSIQECLDSGGRLPLR